MKYVNRLILALALAGTFVAVSGVKMFADGGPIPTCPPSAPHPCGGGCCGTAGGGK